MSIPRYKYSVEYNLIQFLNFFKEATKIAIYISAEIKLRDEKNLRRDIYFMKEFETFLGLFLSRA